MAAALHAADVDLVRERVRVGGGDGGNVVLVRVGEGDGLHDRVMQSRLGRSADFGSLCSAGD